MIKGREISFAWPVATDTADCYAAFVDILGSILTDCNQFETVELVKPSGSTTNTDYAVNCKIDGNTVFTVYPPIIATGSTTKGFTGFNAKAYWGNGLYSFDSFYGYSVNSYQDGYGLTQAWTTSNGALLRYRNGMGYYGAIVIAKSGDEYPILVLKESMYNADINSNVATHATNLRFIHYTDFSVASTNSGSDSATPYVLRFNITAKQSVMCPFAGFGGLSNLSYTKYGFWLPEAPNSIRNGGCQRITLDGKNYVTDGYYTLRDG